MKRIIFAAIAFCGLGLTLALIAPEMASASPKTEICEGVGAVAPGGCKGGTAGLDRIVKTVIDLFSRIIGIVAVIMVMYGGFKYVTAGGDAGKVGEAKKTIIYAVIGIVVAAFAQALVFFVLKNAGV